MSTTEHELRCAFCSTGPLLATYGLRRGRLFVRVKVWKQNRLFAEIIAEGGPLKIKCRNCLRWCTVIFEPTRVRLSDQPVPDAAEVGG